MPEGKHTNTPKKMLILTAICIISFFLLVMEEHISNLFIYLFDGDWHHKKYCSDLIKH